MQIDDLLKIAIEMDASDVHVKVGNYPQFRVHGVLVPLTQLPRFSAKETEDLAFQILNEQQKKKLEDEFDLDLAYSLPGFGRFRGSIFRQRGSIAVALRIIPFEVKNFKDLLLPDVTAVIANLDRGLVLVTGLTGSGKRGPTTKRLQEAFFDVVEGRRPDDHRWLTIVERD